MKEIEIPEGYEAKIDGNKVIIELKESGDEKIRKELLEVIRHCYEDGGYTLCTDDYKKYSAYLEKQKEQKPEEWSEEDEEMKARVIRRYTDYEGVIMRTKEESIAAKMLDAMAQEEVWLYKSLRPQPHWKPSKEQMEALENSTALNDEQGAHLYSLFCDLKKL